MAQWYYSHPGQKPSGPCGLDDLKKLVAAGKLGPQDLVWKAGSPEWQPISAVPDVAAALPGASSAAADAGPEEDFSFATPEKAAALAPKKAAPSAAAASVAASAAAAPVPSAPAPAPAPAKPEPEPQATSGFFARLHSALPKPVLFGIYGALGGLLGALILGEAVQATLHPQAAAIGPLKMALSPTLTVYPGSSNKIGVEIKRLKFEGEVSLRVLNPPKKIDVTQTIIAANDTKAELVVSAESEAKIGDYALEVRATVQQPPFEEVTETIRITVVPTPPTLLVSAPSTVMVYPGAKNTFGVMIARRLFDGPVQLEILDLPKHVNIPLIVLGDKQVETKLDVTVAKEVDAPATFPLKLQARSKTDSKIVATQTIELHVIPVPGKLQLATPKAISVYPGDKNKFTVQIARHEFTSPVQIDVAEAPPDVRIASVTIPDKATSAVLEVSAGQTVGNFKLQVRAQATADRSLATVQFMQLTVAPPPPSIQLAVSPKVSAYPNGDATFGVKIARNRFAGPVTVELAGGAKKSKGAASTVTIPADQTTGELQLHVDNSFLAKKLPFTMPVQVVARGPQGAAGSDTLQLQVLPPPSDLHITVSPEVEVFQGSKCRFTIKVARTGFVGPVQVQFESLPAAFHLPPVQVPAAATELVVEGQAALSAPLGKHKIDVKATLPKPAPDGKTPAAESEFTLHVKPLDPSKRPPPLDIVFVLDTSSSMDPQIQGIRDGIGQFVGELKKHDLEARIAMVAFKDLEYDKDAVKVLKFTAGAFTADPKAFAAEVGKIKADGGGDEPESSLDAIFKATEQEFRPKTLRVLLLVTDALPQTKGNAVTMPKAVKALKDKGVDQVHLIINKKHLPGYQPLQAEAKGTFFDLENASKKGFASLLPILSGEIARITVADQPAGPLAKEPPPLPKAKEPPSIAAEKTPNPTSEKAPVPPKVEEPVPPKANPVEIIRAHPPEAPKAAAVAPPEAELPTLQGVQSTQVYSEKDKIQLLIAIALWTAVVAAFIALTLVTAQKLYLQQAWPTIGDMGKALLAGFTAGVVGGVLSQLFFQATSGDSAWVIVSRVIAWTILGGLIGAGMGFFVPNLRLQRAFLGGCIGGCIGGLSFALVAILADANAMVARWVGAALVGFCIGLMIALAEVAFRRYWLEVAFGEREIRTVTLGAATVAIGGDEKQASVYVPNAPARAFGYRVHKNRVFCEDFGTEKMLEVNPGDSRKVAAAKITVCSAQSAKPTGASLKLYQVRQVSLLEGMPLTAEDIPGLEAQGRDGIVALVSRRPNDPRIFLLRNRSKQPWTVTEADGKKRSIDPGLGIELTSPCEIDFGQVRAKLDPGAPAAGTGLPKEEPPKGGSEPSKPALSDAVTTKPRVQKSGPAK